MATNEKRLIKMDDGREVTFGKVEKVRKEILRDTDGRPLGIRFDGDNGDSFFANGADLPDAEWLSLAEATGVSLWSMWHGYSQKIGDSYASLDTAGDCLEAARAVWARICKGQWQSDTRGFGGSSILLEAILLAFPTKADGTAQTREGARAILQDMSAAERLALQLSPEVKVHFDRLQAKKAGGDVAALAAKFK